MDSSNCKQQDFAFTLVKSKTTAFNASIPVRPAMEMGREIVFPAILVSIIFKKTRLVRQQSVRKDMFLQMELVY